MVYAGADLAASVAYEGYSFTDQTISELSAVGAPTRTLWVTLSVVYSLLRIAFGVGIWRLAGRTHKLQIVAVCIAMIGFLGVVAWPFAPIHQREVLASGGSSASDTLHVILVAADSLLFVIAAGVGSTAFGKRFRLYSIATILVVLIAGAIAGGQSSEIREGEPTPGIGIWERIAVYGALLWTSALAIRLWQHREPSHQTNQDSNPES